MQWKYRENL